MDFEIVYYKDSSGKNPVDEYLLDLAITRKILFQQTAKGINKLRNRAYHKAPLSKYVEPGLWELRIRADNNILRILFTFAKNRTIILLHIFIKKQQKTPTKELEIARQRLKELKES